MKANRILLQRKYARIVDLFAHDANLPLEESLRMFYDSKTFSLIDEGVADMHCLSERYLTDELLREYSITPTQQ